MMAAMMVSGGRPIFHPVFEKFDESHVNKFLDQSHEEDMARLRQGGRRSWFVLGYSLLALGLLVFLLVFLLPEHKDLLTDILTIGAAIAGGFAGGFGGGYGYRVHLERKRE